MSDDMNNGVNTEKKEFKVPEAKNNNYGLIYLFLFTFVIGIIIVSVLLKGFTPNMDLEIGENPVAAMNQRDGDENYNVRMQIDQRLKMIQNDDEMPGVSENKDYETPDEIVKRLREDISNEGKKSEISKDINDEPETRTHTMEPVRVNPEDFVSSQSITKIYVGQYSDMQKAVDMQANIMNSGINVEPVIKTVNGYYTVQVGAYSNPESAKKLTNELINAGFAAKTVKEIR